MTNKIVLTKDIRDKIDEVYRQCLVEMNASKTTNEKGTCKAGLHECGRFGESGVWDMQTWTDEDKQTVKNTIGEADYEKAMICLRPKTKKVVLDQLQKRTRVVTEDSEKPGMSASSSRSRNKSNRTRKTRKTAKSA